MTKKTIHSRIYCVYYERFIALISSFLLKIMEIKSEVLHNLIDAEVENIDFLLNLINSNKDLSLSLINTFISTIEFHSTSEDLEFFNKMLLELQVSINDNSRIESELAEIKALFEKMSSRLDKSTLITALDAIKEKQAEVHQIELKLFSFTPQLLNTVNQNILNIKHKDLRDEIKRIMPKTFWKPKKSIGFRQISSASRTFLAFSFFYFIFCL